ncbi:MAG: ribonucleoprotein complex subunit 4 [Candidatus Methanomethylophilaceae archaeon]|nr:ribonucleoprotein complex subunit 4 [Candidatus Methanomethylophilaceae archaeon]
MRITISGPPGSGKTTVCARLSKALGYRAEVFGQVFRDMAASKGISVAELGAMAEKDPSIDREIDSIILQVAKENDDIILESRLSAYLTKKNGIEAFRIYLHASPEVRMRRICVREDEEFDRACNETIEREESEAKRYMTYYGIDTTDLSVYDLIINTDKISPNEVVDKILGALNDRNACKRP